MPMNIENTAPVDFQALAKDLCERIKQGDGDLIDEDEVNALEAGVTELIAERETFRASLTPPPDAAQAVAWIRYLPDGLYEGPIHNAQMDDMRRRSGKWLPLTHPTPAPFDDAATFTAADMASASAQGFRDGVTAAGCAGPNDGKRLDIVPGVMRCAKCDLRIVCSTLHVHSGTISPSESRTEKCPNGCGPLWPITWEQEAREAMALVNKLHDQLHSAQPAAGVPEWTDEQCVQFACVAFRHAPKNLPKGVTLEDIRMGARRVLLAAAPQPEGRAHIQAPTGQAPRKWTEQEKADVLDAKRYIVERERQAAPQTEGRLDQLSPGWRDRVCGNPAPAGRGEAVPVGMAVSVDVSTGDDDFDNRIYARVIGMEYGNREPIILCEEESRNFAAAPVADAEGLKTGDRVVWTSAYGAEFEGVIVAYTLDLDDGTTVTRAQADQIRRLSGAAGEGG